MYSNMVVLKFLIKLIDNIFQNLIYTVIIVEFVPHSALNDSVRFLITISVIANAQMDCKTYVNPIIKKPIMPNTTL